MDSLVLVVNILNLIGWGMEASGGFGSGQLVWRLSLAAAFMIYRRGIACVEAG